MSDQLQEAAPRVMIFNMSFEVPGEVLDALAKQRDLHFGRAGIRAMTPEPLYYFLALRLSNSHKSPLFFSFSFIVEQNFYHTQIPL